MKNKCTFHLLGIPHLPCNKDYSGCAFSMKVFKMAQMLKSLGYKVYYYGAEGSKVECDEFIQTHTLKDIRDSYGEGDNRFEIGYDWEIKGFKHDFNTKRTPVTLKYYQNCIDEINKRKKPYDFLLLSQGVYQKSISDKVELFLTCEPGVGYRGSFTRFKAFESSYLQNFTYGSQYPGKCINGNYYDRVIPNYFDPDDFEYREKKDDYFLFLGRLIQRKGIITAHLATKAIGVKLKIAGQGMKSWDGYKLIGEDFEIEGDNLDFVGYADMEKRKKLYSHARATFVPTIYLEAFGGVAVESQISGTPSITTNFGVFPETVQDKVTGFRCNTLNDFVEATRNVNKLKPKVIRKWAEKYLMDNVKWEFKKWFEDLYQLYLSAQDNNVKAWHYIGS